MRSRAENGLRTRILNALSSEGGEGLASHQICRRIGLVDPCSTQKELNALRSEGLAVSLVRGRNIATLWWRSG
jgi:hypothetical protein